MTLPVPPLPRDRRIVDEEHLRLLAIFHFVVAGLAFAGLGFLFLHYLLMSTVMNNPHLWQGKANQGPNPAEFFAIFKWFYLIMGTFMVLTAIGNLLSGLYLRRRQHRIFSFVVAALNCFHIPFGTVLGVFTIVVLVRESVIELYAGQPS
jgi:hypothetical protein